MDNSPYWGRPRSTSVAPPSLFASLRLGPRWEDGASAWSSKTSVRIEVIPWETKAGQFGVAIWRDEMTDAYFVGSRSEAEREASRGPFE